jgi:hypothetical protein
MRALNKAEKETKGRVHTKLREAAGVVRAEAATRFLPYSQKTAGGFRIRSRVGGVYVEQKLRKVTGQHPEWGRLQLVRALEPALDAKSREVEHKLEQALDELADIVD